MVRGKTIRIYLADGTVTGIRHAEILNWTGQGIACPRNKISDLAEWEESKLPGVYFLFGFSEFSEKPIAYIGEAENILTRLQYHLKNKDFWNEVIFFTNKDENLTKSHAKFLEAKIIDRASFAERYIIENDNQSNLPILPRSDRDAMEDFLDCIRLVLGALAHRILEPIIQNKNILRDELQDNEISQKNYLLELKLVMKIKNIQAEGILTDEGFVVLNGSDSRLEDNGLREGYKKHKQNLIREGVLVEKDGKFKFSKEILFPSPSFAAAIIAGQQMNGRTSWKNLEGKTLKEIEYERTDKL